MTNRRTGLSRLRVGVPAVGDLFSVVRQLSFDELRDEATLPPRLLLLGNELSTLKKLRAELVGESGVQYIEIALVGDALPYLDSYDGIVLVNLSPSERNVPTIARLLTSDETAGRTLTCQLPPTPGQRDTALPSDLIDDLRGRIVTRLAHRQLALGRYLPAFRKQAAAAAIGQTARANAEFALLSNIPALIPVVGNIVAAGADFLVLTKNQLMLIYKMAAIHGRDLGQPWRIYAEMLPIVGAGILWRTIARELSALIPFAAGTIPKVLVAYAGTAVAGQTANLYYLQGTRPTGEQVQGFYVRAIEMARKLPFLNRNTPPQGTIIEGQFTEKRPEEPQVESPRLADPPMVEEGEATHESILSKPAEPSNMTAGTAQRTNIR
jgi:uncharacterized protein (DUF697 family)